MIRTILVLARQNSSTYWPFHIPNTICTSTPEISIECFEKSKANKKLLPLSSIKNYIIIYNESQVPCKKPRFDRSPSHVQSRNQPGNANNIPQIKTSLATNETRHTTYPSQGTNASALLSPGSPVSSLTKSAELVSGSTRHRNDLRQQRNALSSSLVQNRSTKSITNNYFQ